MIILTTPSLSVPVTLRQVNKLAIIVVVTNMVFCCAEPGVGKWLMVLTRLVCVNIC